MCSVDILCPAFSFTLHRSPWYFLSLLLGESRWQAHVTTSALSRVHVPSCWLLGRRVLVRVLLVYASYLQRHMHTGHALWKPPVLVSITSFSVP